MFGTVDSAASNKCASQQLALLTDFSGSSNTIKSAWEFRAGVPQWFNWLAVRQLVCPKGQSTAICIPPGVVIGFLSHHSTLIFLSQKETHCQLS